MFAASAVRNLLCAGLFCTLPLFSLGAGRAEPNSDSAAITAALLEWRDDFNAGDPAGACGLFADDLVARVRGAKERGKTETCRLIASALERHGRGIRYDVTIDEIIVSGDLAIVRLVWTLTVNGEASDEPGLDVFRRQPDGSWKIARFLAYAENDEFGD